MYSKKIVFTGGPCAGKTTLIERLENYLKTKDCEVIVIPETATEIFGWNIRYNMLKTTQNFQKIILDNQKSKEDIVDYILEVNKNTNKNYIIIYDRGILDNKAYFDDYKGFEKLFKDKILELDFLDNYDCVFDLITLADCNKELYNLSSNEARHESVEEAIAVDRKTSNAWVGHRNLKIINTSISIDEEFEIIKKEIDNVLNGYSKKNITSIEIDNDIYDFNKYNDNNSRLIDIEENILEIPNKSNAIYKVYKRTYKNFSTYILNVSYIKDNELITIFDSKITEEEYKKLISKYSLRTLNYKQLSFIENKQLYDVKFYSDKTMLEYEENKLNDKLVLPSCIKLIEKSYDRNLILKPLMKFSRVKDNLIAEN